ncbi:hypothetical protein TeGR_g4691 [Tetraparma gracilis]|uniref:SAP domain-containing protein n=1 Tax=Tetraparma gracilis TaxID=2962635 RepID=A0ABQ6M451_9STRA|nr:hypothetical protein TeGR_g4691 [Tetraparma gracilis]
MASSAISMPSLSSLTVPALKVQLSSLGLPTSGLKAALVARLESASAPPSPALGLETLPTDCLRCIFTFLPISTIKSCSWTCLAFDQAVDEKFLRRAININFPLQCIPTCDMNILLRIAELMALPVDDYTHNRLNIMRPRDHGHQPHYGTLAYRTSKYRPAETVEQLHFFVRFSFTPNRKLIKRNPVYIEPGASNREEPWGMQLHELPSCYIPLAPCGQTVEDLGGPPGSRDHDRDHFHFAMPSCPAGKLVTEALTCLPGHLPSTARRINYDIVHLSWEIIVVDSTANKAALLFRGGHQVYEDNKRTEGLLAEAYEDKDGNTVPFEGSWRASGFTGLYPSEGFVIDRGFRSGIPCWQNCMSNPEPYVTSNLKFVQEKEESVLQNEGGESVSGKLMVPTELSLNIIHGNEYEQEYRTSSQLQDFP